VRFADTAAGAFQSAEQIMKSLSNPTRKQSSLLARLRKKKNPFGFSVFGGVLAIQTYGFNHHKGILAFF